MPILNLENPKFISVDKAGRSNSSGTVEVYAADGLFTTLATVYADQVKTSELTNPVTLDADGTREIWYDVKVDIREKTSSGVVIGDTLNLDPNAAQASVQSFNLAQNGSFEVDSTSDGQPDNWTITPYTGSSIAITETVVTNGTKALEFNVTGAGTGGGTATSAKFPVTEGTTCSVSFSVLVSGASAETSTNTFVIEWYDEDGVSISNSSVTVTHAAVDTWYNLQQEVTVAATATQGEIVLTGIASGGVAKSSKAYFDGISVINDLGIVTLGSTQTLTNKTIGSGYGGGDVIRGAAATASGDTEDFTIPSWVKKITVMLHSLVTTGATARGFIVQIGTGGTPTTSGYNGMYGQIHFDDTSSGSNNVTSSLTVADSRNANTDEASGNITITNIDGNKWVMTGIVASIGGVNSIIYYSVSEVELAGVLDMVRVSLTSTGDCDFNGGTVNILYEG